MRANLSIAKTRKTDNQCEPAHVPGETEGERFELSVRR